MSRHPFFRRLIAPVLVCLTLGASAAADAPVTLDPEQLRHAAGAALKLGDTRRALAYSDALLARDPNDLTAQLIRARALRDLDQLDDARRSARAAWSKAETPSDKYSAAMVMAQVQSSVGNKTIAQWWLRRAVELAPEDELERRAIRDFLYVRATNPWSTRLTFSITPDSNINNGSSSRTSFLNYRLTEVLFGQPLEYSLNGAARALSGIEYAFGFDTRYRLFQTAEQAHDLFFSMDIRRYTLSDDAREAAPDASGSDFSYTSAQGGYGYRFINFDGRGEMALRGNIGQSWYAGEEYVRFARASAIQSYALTPSTRINGRISGERQLGITTNDLDTIRLDVWTARFFSNGLQLRLSATGAAATSDTVGQSFDEFGLRASLAVPNPFDGIDLQFGLGWRNRDYDQSIHSPDGRQDHRFGAEMTVIFDRIDYMGFNPTMTLYGSVTDSNIGLYESERLGINFGIQSAF